MAVDLFLGLGLLVLQLGVTARGRAALLHHAVVVDDVPLVVVLVLVVAGRLVVILVRSRHVHVELLGLAGRVHHAAVDDVLAARGLAVAAVAVQAVLHAGFVGIFVLQHAGVDLFALGVLVDDALVAVVALLAEDLLQDLNRIEALALFLGEQGVAGVLVHLAAGHGGGERHAHAGYAGRRQVHGDGVDRAVGIRIDVHGAALGGHLGRAADRGSDGAEGHVHLGRDADRSRARARDGGHDVDQGELIPRLHVHARRVRGGVGRRLGVGGHLRAGLAFGEAAFDHGARGQLADGQLQRAADARHAADGGAHGVGGDDLAGVREHVHRAARVDHRRSSVLGFLVFVVDILVGDARVGRILEVADDQHGRHARRAADGSGERRVHKDVVAVGLHVDRAVRVRRAAHPGPVLAAEHRRVRAHAHAGRAAAAEGQRQQPHVVVGIGGHADIAAGLRVAVGLGQHILREHQRHDGRAHAGGSADAHRARTVEQHRVVSRVDGDVAGSGTSSFYIIVSRDHRRLLGVGLDHVLDDQRVHHAAARTRRRSADRDGGEDHALPAGCAHIDAATGDDRDLLAEDAFPDQVSQGLVVQARGDDIIDIVPRLRDQHRIVAQLGLDRVQVDHGGQDRTDRRAAAGEGDAARGVHQHGVEIGFDADAALRRCGEAASILVGDAALGDDHRDGTGYRGTAGGSGHGHVHQHGHVLRQRLGQDVLASSQDRVVRVHAHVAIEHVHAHRRADRYAAASRAGGSDDAVGNHAVGLGQHVHVVGLGDDLRAVAQIHIGVRPCDEHAKRASHSVSGTTGRRGGGGDDGDQALLVDGGHAGVAAPGFQLGTRAHDSLGEGLVDGHVHRAANCGGATRGRDAQRDQQQVFVGLRVHVQLAAGGDAGVVAHLGHGLVVGDDHVDRAANAVALRARCDGRRHGEQLDVGIHCRVLGIIAIHVDGGVFLGGVARDGHRAHVAGGGLLRQVAHGSLHVVIVDQHRQVEADAHFGGRHAQRTRDHSGVAAAPGVDGHAAVQFLDHLAVVVEHLDHFAVLVQQLAHGHSGRADPGADLVVEIDHRHGARHGRLGVAGRGRDDGARDGFSVIVRAGQEVQHIDSLHQIAAGDFDVNLVTAARLVLLHVEDAGVGVFVRFGGIGHQAVRAPGEGIILHGDHLLLGGQIQPVAGDGRAVANAGFHFVVAEDGGEGSADAHAGALGHADGASPDGELALVGGVNIDGPAFDPGVVGHFRGGHGVADQHGDRAGDGGLAAAAGDRARQRLGGDQAAILAGGVLGQVSGDGDVAGLAIVAHDLAADEGVGLVAVHAHRHTHRDGVGVLRQRHGRAGTQRAEVALVARNNLRAASSLDLALHLRVGLVLADRQADRRGDLYLLASLLITALALAAVVDARAKVLPGLPVGLLEALARAAAASIRVLIGVLALHHIRGERRVVLGFIAVGIVWVGVALFLIELVVDVAGRAVVVALTLALVLAHVVIDRAGCHVIDFIFGNSLGMLDLLGVALHVGAHRGGERIRLVLAGADGGDEGRAVLQRRLAEEIGGQLGGHDVQRHGRAHGGGAAHRKAAGLRQGDAGLLGGHQEVRVVDLWLDVLAGMRVDLQEILIRLRSLELGVGHHPAVLQLVQPVGGGLRGVPRFIISSEVFRRILEHVVVRQLAAVLRLDSLDSGLHCLGVHAVVGLQPLVVFAAGLFAGGRRGLRIDLDGIPAGGSDDRAGAHAGIQHVVQQAHRDGGIHRDILGLGLIRIGRRFRRTVVGAAGQRIGTRRAGALHLAVGQRANLHGIGGDDSVIADLRAGADLAVGEREGCADTHGLALVVGSLVLGRGLLRGKRHVQLDVPFAFLVADVPRHEQREAAVLADGNGAALYGAILVQIGHGGGGRQHMQVVYRHRAPQLVLAALYRFDRAARAHVLQERVFLAAGSLGEQGLGLNGLLHLVDRFGLIDHADLGDLTLGHVEAVDSIRRRGALDDNRFFCLCPVASLVGVVDPLQAMLLFLAVLGDDLDARHGDLHQVADHRLNRIALLLLLAAVHFHVIDFLARLFRNRGERRLAVDLLLGSPDVVQDLVEQHRKGDGLLRRVLADVARLDEAEHAVVHLDGTVLLGAAAVQIGVGHRLGQLVRALRIIGRIQLQRAGPPVAVGRGSHRAALAGLDLELRRDEIDAQRDFVLGSVLADVARDHVGEAALALLVIVEAFLFGSRVHAHDQRAGLDLAGLIGIGIGDLAGQAVAVLDRQRHNLVRAFLEGCSAAVGVGDLQFDIVGFRIAARANGDGRRRAVSFRSFLRLIDVLRVDDIVRAALLVLVGGTGGAAAGVGVAVDGFRAGGRGDHLLVIRGADGQTVLDIDGIGAGLAWRQIGDLRLGGARDHGNSHAAGDAHLGSARACDGLGANHMLAGDVLRLQLHVQRVGQRIQRGVGNRQAGVLHSRLQPVLQILGEVARLRIGDELFNVHEALRASLQNFGAEILHGGREFLLQLGLQLGLVHDDVHVQALHDVAQHSVGLGGCHVDGFLLGVVQRVGEHALHALLEDGGVEVLAAQAVLHGLQADVQKFLRGVQADLLRELLQQPGAALAADEFLLERIDDRGFQCFDIAFRKLRVGLLADHALEDAFELQLQLLRNTRDIVLDRSAVLRELVAHGGKALKLQDGLEAGAVEHRVGEVVGNVADELADASGDLVRVLHQTHLVHHVGDQVVQQLLQLFSERGLSVGRVDLAGRGFLCRVSDDRANVQGIRLDLRQRDAGNVVDLDDIDRHADAHADVALGGGGVGLDDGLGAVLRHHVDAAVHALLPRRAAVLAGILRRADRLDDRAVVDFRLGGILLDVQHKARGHGHAALAGLRLLAAGAVAHDAAGVDVVGSVDPGKASAARDHVVSLAVGAAGGGGAAVAAARAFRAGNGNTCDRAVGIRTHIHAIGRHAVGQARQRAVVDDGDVKAAADGRPAALRGGVRGHVVLGVVPGVHHDGFEGVAIIAADFFQLIHRAQRQGDGVTVPISQLAQVGLSVAAGDVQRQHGRNGNAAARGACLGGHRIVHRLGGHDGDAIQIGTGLLPQLHAVLHSRDGVRAGDGDADARAHAGGGRLLVASRVGLGAKVHVGVRLHVKIAAGQGDVRCPGVVVLVGNLLENLCVGLGGGDIHAHRTADADVAFGITGGRFERGVRLGGLSVHGEAAGLDDAALDDRVVGAARHGDAHGHARAQRRGLRIVAARLELRGHFDGRVVRCSGGNHEAPCAGVGLRAGNLDGAAIGLPHNRLHRAVLHAVGLGLVGICAVRRADDARRDHPATLGELGAGIDGDRAVRVLAKLSRRDGHGQLGDGDAELDVRKVQPVRFVGADALDGEGAVRVLHHLELGVIQRDIHAVDRCRRHLGDLIADSVRLGLGFALAFLLLDREGNGIAFVKVGLHGGDGDDGGIGGVRLHRIGALDGDSLRANFHLDGDAVRGAAGLGAAGLPRGSRLDLRHPEGILAFVGGLQLDGHRFGLAVGNVTDRDPLDGLVGVRFADIDHDHVAALGLGQFRGALLAGLGQADGDALGRGLRGSSAIVGFLDDNSARAQRAAVRRIGGNDLHDRAVRHIVHQVGGEDDLAVRVRGDLTRLSDGCGRIGFLGELVAERRAGRQAGFAGRGREHIAVVPVVFQRQLAVAGDGQLHRVRLAVDVGRRMLRRSLGRRACLLLEYRLNDNLGAFLGEDFAVLNAVAGVLQQQHVGIGIAGRRQHLGLAIAVEVGIDRYHLFDFIILVFRRDGQHDLVLLVLVNRAGDGAVFRHIDLDGVGLVLGPGGFRLGLFSRLLLLGVRRGDGGVRGDAGAIRGGAGDGRGDGGHVHRAAGFELAGARVDDGAVVVQHDAHRQRAGHLHACRAGIGRLRACAGGVRVLLKRGREADVRRAGGDGIEVASMPVGSQGFGLGLAAGRVSNLQRTVRQLVDNLLSIDSRHGGIDDDLHGLTGLNLHFLAEFAQQQRAVRDALRDLHLDGGGLGALLLGQVARQVGPARAASTFVKEAGDVVIQVVFLFFLFLEQVVQAEVLFLLRLGVLAEQAAQALVLFLVVRRGGGGGCFLLLIGDSDDDVIGRHRERPLVRAGVIFRNIDGRAHVVSAAAGREIAVGDLIDLPAFLRRNGHLHFGVLVGLAAGNGDLSLVGLVLHGGRHGILRRGQAHRQLVRQVFPADHRRNFAQQQLGNVFHIIHCAGGAVLVAGAFLFRAFFGVFVAGAFTAALAFAFALALAFAVAFAGGLLGLVHHGGNGIRGHIGVGGGVHGNVALRGDFRVRVHLRRHVLHQHVDGKVAAGLARVGISLGGVGHGLHVAHGIQQDVAVAGFQARRAAVAGDIVQRAANLGVHIGHDGGNAQRERQVAGRGAGLDVDLALGLGGDVASRLQHRAVEQVDLGIQHGDADRQRRQIAVAAAGLNERIHAGVHLDGALVVVEPQGWIGFERGCGAGRFSRQHGVEIDARVNLAGHVDLRAANFHVHKVQDVGDRGDVQDAAVFNDGGGYVHVAAGVHHGILADDHFGAVGHVEEVGDQRLAGVHHVAQADAAFLFVAIAFAIAFVVTFTIIAVVVAVTGSIVFGLGDLRFLARGGGQLHILSGNPAVQYDLLSLDDQVHVPGNHVVQLDGAAVLLDVRFVDDQLVQHAAAALDDDRSVILGGGRHDDVIGKRGFRRVDRGLLAVHRGHGQVVVRVGLCQVDLHLVLVQQLVAEDALGVLVHGDGQHVAAAVLEVEGLRLAGRARCDAVIFFLQRAAHVQMVGILVLDFYLIIYIARCDIHVHLVVALAGIHGDGVVGYSRAVGARRRYARLGQRHCVVARAGVHLDVLRAFSGLDVHGVVLGGADDGQRSVRHRQLLLQRQVDARQQHVDAVNVDIAVHLRGAGGGRGIVIPILFGVHSHNLQKQVRGQLIQQRTAAGMNGILCAVDGDIAVILTRLHLDGNFGGVGVDAAQRRVDRLLDGIMYDRTLFIAGFVILKGLGGGAVLVQNRRFAGGRFRLGVHALFTGGFALAALDRIRSAGSSGAHRALLRLNVFRSGPVVRALFTRGFFLAAHGSIRGAGSGDGLRALLWLNAFRSGSVVRALFTCGFPLAAHGRIRGAGSSGAPRVLLRHGAFRIGLGVCVRHPVGGLAFRRRSRYLAALGRRTTFDRRITIGRHTALDRRSAFNRRTVFGWHTAFGRCLRLAFGRRLAAFDRCLAALCRRHRRLVTSGHAGSGGLVCGHSHTGIRRIVYRTPCGLPLLLVGEASSPFLSQDA